MIEQLKRELAKQGEAMIRDHRALHQIPEVGWTLPETSAYLMESLREAGIAAELLAEKYILVRLGRGGSTVLLRAEMDGLPEPELSQLPYRSLSRNSHCRGHDLQMAMLLALARVLKAHEEALPGQVLLLFQPAGELGVGMKLLVERGLLDELGVRSVLAFHLDEGAPAGHVVYAPGVFTANLIAFYISVHGQSGPGYVPSRAASPLTAAAYIQLMLGALLQCELPPEEQAVLSVGRAGGGAVATQIPGEADVQGSIRCFSDEMRQRMAQRVQEIADGVCHACRNSASVNYITTPSLVNDADLFATLRPVLLESLGGPERFHETPRSMGAEDLAYASRCVPTAFFTLGWVKESEEPLPQGAELLLSALWRLWQTDNMKEEAN